ncbi:MAG: imidazole glycerol phosphate synthase subunit HisH [Nitriliruptoraceae bacterium]
MSRRRTAAILDYDAGNVRSAKRGFEAAGAQAEIVRTASEAADADVLVIPGVGNFDPCIQQLRRSGLQDVIRDAIAAGRPVFGICVGMQLLYGSSEEGQEPGLGLLPGRVERFPSTAVVPHIGWDTVRPATGKDDDPLLADVAGERFYFVHSYYAVPSEASHVIARTAYGGVAFPCLVREGSVVGTQFHPEKSGPLGARLLRNWLESLD